MALRSRVLAVVAVALPLVLAAGCSGSTPPGAASAARTGPGGGIPAGPAPGPQSLSETGSTLLFPVLRNWAAAYRQQRLTRYRVGGAVPVGAADQRPLLRGHQRVGAIDFHRAATHAPYAEKQPARR